MQKAALQTPLCLNDNIGRLAENITKNWLIGLRETNPAIIEMFRDRDKKPYRDMLPWSGEFAGKYITGAYYIYQLTNDQKLYEYIMGFIDELIGCIDSDGYIGCYQKQCRMTGAFSTSPEKTGETWDAWSHYHIMLGLLLWYRETNKPDFLEAVKKIAGFFLDNFYSEGKKRLCDMGSTEMNLAPIHIFALLYEETKDKKYLDFALEIEKDLASPDAGNYMAVAAEGTDFYKCSKPRWESLHIIIGIAEMYFAAENPKYKHAAEHLFYSILKTDIHNTGAFSTDEMAVGTPFKRGNVELCCAIAFNALACEVFRLTGDPAIADHLELSLYNAIAGSFSPSGRWSTYNTPMEGEKAANYHSIWFQCRPGSPDLNCCSANSARGIGMLSQWAVTDDADTVYLNYFGAFSCRTASGLGICISGDYPACDEVKINLVSEAKKRIAIRIPAWSEKTVISIGSEEFYPEPGKYFIIERIWVGEDIKVKFDFTPVILRGKDDFEGKSCVYAGPVLYGFENSDYCETDLAEIGNINLSVPKDTKPQGDKSGRILLKLPKDITLCDFRSLGISGSAYTTWLNID